MTDRPTPAHLTALHSALLGPAHGFPLDDADLDKIATPSGHSRAAFLAAARTVAREARDAHTEGRSGDARRLILEHCQQYDGLQTVADPTSTTTDGLDPDQLAALITR
jgi:hypothetical protein